ncbi:MAG TPA: glycoside hydrolase family 2 TIM barrel-domain containing protein [Planctomycetaceae bacterium]|nr:glycoside hydrolase family 2 TIM barrel-domain containing protein [Planctomycetaceae bacterium]
MLLLSRTVLLRTGTSKCVAPAVLAFVAALPAGFVTAADWKPAEGPLMTRWAKDVPSKKPLNDYPRPQMRREQWRNLNGLWQYAIAPRDGGKPEAFEGEILVPFPVESALSGVMRQVGPENRLWYRRTFTLPRDIWDHKRVLLHFGAVDWHATVWLDGHKLGEHRGGYDPFSFDITEALGQRRVDSESGPADGSDAPPEGHELVVSVWDPSDQGPQPRGKQVQNPHGIWYTPVTGIWQTVWLEGVPDASIRSLHIVPDVDTGTVRVRASCVGTDGRHRIVVSVSEPDQPVEDWVSSTGAPAPDTIEVAIRSPRLWSPDEPFLYNVIVRLDEGGRLRDVVGSYCGLRKIEVRKDAAGVNRLFLNNEPLFQFGLLDQGWWPDGLYTAPTDDALKYDIEVTKQLGFNMARKHVKVEPARWYYWCDKLGLLVWQDMPNGDRHIRREDPDIERSPESEESFRREWQAIIDACRNHPSIVTWVPFNEGWGQFKTDQILAWTKAYDPTRLVDGPSGWTDRGTGDMHDMHRYPGPGMPPLEDRRAVVLGEFGGLGLPLEGHTWLDKGNWGYRTFQDRESLVAAYKRLIGQLYPLISEGLAAAIYTQTTDVEIEVNGVMTYDRAVIKLPDDVAALHAKLYGPPPKIRDVIPTSQRRPAEWNYTTAKPADGWERPAFDDRDWKTGPGGFGTEGTPGTSVRTEWNTPDVWLRRTFELDDADLEHPYLRIHHDENAEVYLNGELVATFEGYTVGYILSPLDAKGRRALRRGPNTLAVHCRQTGGGQYIDVGIAEVVPGSTSESSP